jgi:hypothetical protein
VIPVVLIGTDDRLRGIRDRWTASAPQRTAARNAVDRRDLSLANEPAQLKKREDRLRSRHLRLEGIVEQDDSVWLSFFDCGLKASRSVARVVEAPARQPVQAIGTGSLVTERLLLTNHHVCRTPVTDPALDYTLVAVAERDGQPPGSTYGHIPLIEQTGKAVMGEVLNVIHHPAGDRKRVSLRYNRMVAEDDLWLRYESDTREGSSGAPVFNDQWEMIALHHGGISAIDDEGFELARDGRRWTEDMGEEALAYSGNEGARVSRIVRSLRETDLTPERRTLLATVLNPEE